ncbi:MAG: ABC transporter ATP-binding protein [Endomicrobiales bacterium]
MALLEIKNLSVEYYRGRDVIPAVRGVSLDVQEGETVAIVGESGSGKSTLALSVMGLILPGEGKITSGGILFGGKDLRAFSPGDWRALRGKDISLVFQDPFSSLNPVLTVGDQLTEAITAHRRGAPSKEKKAAAENALREVRFTDPARIFDSFPHQLSGGQRQRVAVAMAILHRPKLLIADEPTTALDVTIQKEVMDLLDTLRNELSLTVLLITHNLPLALERSQRIAVMYAGEIIEHGSREDIFKNPRHPYTRALINSVPRLLGKASRSMLGGQPPDVRSLPPGCAFRPRCESAIKRCATGIPPETSEGSRTAKCFLFPGREPDSGKR